MPNYKKSLENQKVLREFEPTGVEEKFDVLKAIGYAIMAGTAICSGALIVKSCTREPMPAVTSRVMCHECHHFKDKPKPVDKNKKMANYFRAKGSKHSEVMANALNGRKHKRLLAAISIIETGADPTKRFTGYKRKHHGAFQVNPEYWGKVPKDAAGQARQAEAILAELTREMPLQKALSAYGGDSTGAYRKRVMAELQGVPK